MTLVTLHKADERGYNNLMIEQAQYEWPKDIQDDFRAVEMAVEEQRQGKLATDPRELIRRAQEIKDELRRAR